MAGKARPITHHQVLRHMAARHHPTRDMTARKGVADYIFFPVKPAAHTRPSTPVFVLETKADTEVDYVMFPPIHPLLIILCTLCWDEREFWGVCYIISHDA